MALAAGTRIGSYEILSLLGAGGMGEVYRARDARLNRDVAVKVIPRALLDTPPAAASGAAAGAQSGADRAARFAREAQTLAALNHPNIAQVYGFEEHAGTSILIMELVDGLTLDELIARRAPGSGLLASGESTGDALRIARQIADALDAAHEQNVVHRDLKPANVKVRSDGMVKVLDFGLAKIVEVRGAPAGDASASLAVTADGMTSAGVVLGTVPYMSPEQARGRAVDKRTDIWAFGCVLFEMLTGHAAFAAATPSDTIAAVLTREPDWSLLPAEVSAGVRQLLRKCLEKDPRRRLRDIGDAAAYLDDAPFGAPVSFGVPVASATQAAKSRAPRQRRAAALMIGAAVLLAAAGALLERAFARGTSRAEVVRLSLSAPGHFYTEPPSAVISPDGRTLVFVAADSSGRIVLWIRDLDAQAARALPGTAGADEPFWSPDSRQVGFFADGDLKTTPAAGGPVQVLTKAPVSPGGSWNAEGTIIFASNGDLSKISASGGTASPLGTPPPGGRSWPHFLPDGRHFLYFGRGPQGKPGVSVGSIDSAENTRLFDSEFEAAYAPPGYLLFLRDETLFAQPFDAARLALTGEPVAVSSGAWGARGYGHGVYSAGSNGVLAYVDAAIADTQLTWFDRQGHMIDVVGPARRYDSPPQLSPDGTTIAVARGAFFQQDIWLLEKQGANETRLTFGGAGNRVPIWLRDGRRLLFQSARMGGVTRLFQKNADGGGSEDLLAPIDRANPQDVSPDGRVAVYMVVGKTGRFELWGLPLSGERTAFPFLQTDANNGQAQLSPDGKWIAYTSNESGRDEVFVQSFPSPGSKRQISIEGGAQARWRRSGGELYYLAPDGTLMAARVYETATLQVDRPAPLFHTPLEYLALQGPLFMPGYDVTADGQRFLLNAPPVQSAVPIQIVLNWTAALNKP